MLGLQLEDLGFKVGGLGFKVGGLGFGKNACWTRTVPALNAES